MGTQICLRLRPRRCEHRLHELHVGHPHDWAARPPRACGEGNVLQRGGEDTARSRNSTVNFFFGGHRHHSNNWIASEKWLWARREGGVLTRSVGGPSLKVCVCVVLV